MASKTRVRAKKVPPKAKHSRATKAGRASATAKRISKEKFAEKIVKHSVRIHKAEDRLTKTVRKNVASALRDPSLAVNRWFDTAFATTKEAMAVVRSTSGDALASTRAVTRGVLLGVSDAGGDTVKSSGHVVRAAIDSAKDAGGDATAVGLRAIQGVVDAAHTIGVDVGATARHSWEAGAGTVLSAGESATEAVEEMMKTARARLKQASGKIAAKKKAKKRPAKKPKKKGARTSKLKAGKKSPTKTSRSKSK